MKTINKIDVHHHIFPKEYVTALKDAGVKNSLGVDFPKWTVETSFKKMKENGIKIAMLSISSPGVYFSGIDFPDGFSEKLARMTNEIIAENKNEIPRKIWWFCNHSNVKPGGCD